MTAAARFETRRRGGGRPWRRILAPLAAMSLAALAAGCGTPGNQITVYNGQHLQLVSPLVSQFEATSSTVVSLRTDDEDTLTQQIIAEGSSSPADVMISENSPAVAALSEKGLLQTLPASILDQVPATDRSQTGTWVGISERVSVIVYNPSLISARDIPTSVLQLSAPRFAGKIALAPTESDFLPIVSAVYHSQGEHKTVQWLDGLKANSAAHVYPDDETVTAMVNNGEVALGVVNQYYWYRLRAVDGTSGMHSKIAFFAPGDPGYVIDISAAAVLKSAPQATRATQFVSFLVSEKGQQIIANGESFEYPIRPGVAVGAGQPPLASLAPNPITPAQLGDGSLALSLLHQAGLV